MSAGEGESSIGQTLLFDKLAVLVPEFDIRLAPAGDQVVITLDHPIGSNICQSDVDSHFTILVILQPELDGNGASRRQFIFTAIALDNCQLTTPEYDLVSRSPRAVHPQDLNGGTFSQIDPLCITDLSSQIADIQGTTLLSLSEGTMGRQDPRTNPIIAYSLSVILTITLKGLIVLILLIESGGLESESDIHRFPKLY